MVCHYVEHVQQESRVQEEDVQSGSASVDDLDGPQ